MNELKNGNYILNDFAKKSAFCNFLPGIAGLNGRPIWAFYVNRGQGIAGFGVKDKNSPIMQFFPAEIAYMNAPREGFRTFLRINGEYVEPFSLGQDEKTQMEVMRQGFSVSANKEGSYCVKAEYFGVPSQDYAALARVFTYQNCSDREQEVELLDGLCLVIPYGLSNSAFQDVGNLFKSWMCVEGVNENYAFYRMRSSTADSSEVKEVTSGNFCVSKCDRASVRMIVDPKIVFGEERTRTIAEEFLKNGIPHEAFLTQNTENEFACAFSHVKTKLKQGESVTIVELIGYADSKERVKALSKTLTVDGAFALKEEARAIAEGIASRVETQTAFPVFDEYVKQSYFDNVLRGGMPVTLGKEVYYVYSRKHGDPERDYNFFVIEPQPYSCGNGNFRDVVQNRRNDVYFTPECGDFNVRYFFSLLQADGYNPLSVLGVKYRFTGEIPERYRRNSELLQGEFTVGELCNRLNLQTEEQICEVLLSCEPVYSAAFGEGYWTDHFVYLIDLITSYLGVYPERTEQLLFGEQYKYFASGARVLPQSEKTALTKDGAVRRFHSVVHDQKDGWLKNSVGEEVTTSLAAKLLTLICVKCATLDPMGWGIDMEADKPGWNDATNGLPALFGSNVADLLELKRLIGVYSKLLKECKTPIEWSEEQSEFFRAMLLLLKNNPSREEYYEKSNRLKEEYRQKIYGVLSGKRQEESLERAEEFLSLAAARIERGLQEAKAEANGWYPTYVRYEVEEYAPVEKEGKPAYSAEGLPLVKPLKFRPILLPHFAEGVAKGLTLGEKDLYERAKRSQLHDEKLGLYRSSEPLDGESIQIGRIRSFPKGWLERESCFLHMNYKFVLSLLEAGLYDEFYEEIKSNFVPFMNPEAYGRSPLENSSFIATSNHCDKGKWGKGFQARLTGANAEVLSIWRVMMGIQSPFTVENGTLRFALNPVLHGSFFREDGTVSFLLFNKTKVVYCNPARKNTYGEGARVESYRLIGEEGERTVTSVCGPLAEAVRSGKIHTIEVQLS